LNGTVASIMQSTAQVARISEEATFEFGTGFLPSEVNAGCPTGGAGLAILATAPPEQQEAAFKYIAFATSPEITTFWSQNTGYMPVRKSAISGAEMQEYYKTNPNFQTAVQQLETTQPQDPARVAIPGGDRIIGDGLERITVNQAEVQSTFEDIQSQLEEEAQPVLDALSQIEG
jgi:sn-glycerol 3-phosphate transport system substrate-binding protein